MRQPSHFDYAVYLTEMAKTYLHISRSSAAAAKSYNKSYTGACIHYEKKTFNHLTEVVKIMAENILLNQSASVCHLSAQSSIKVHKGRLLMSNSLNSE